MALVEIRALNSSNYLGIWKIEEQVDELQNQLQLDEIELQYLDGIKAPRRKLQWLATRLLIRRIIKPAGQILMDWNALGKPQIINYDFEVSISHADDLAVALVGTQVSGVDVEFIRDRIEKVAPKFTRDDEFNFIDSEYKERYLTLFWSLKEAVFKKMGGGGIDFKEHIKIMPFNLKNDEGNGEVFYLKNITPQSLRFNYQWLGEAVIVWII